MKKKTAKVKQRSLRWEIMLIVAICWIVPIALILATLSVDTNRTNRERIENEFSVDISHSADLTQRYLLQILAASRTASYDPTIRSTYNHYLKSHDYTAFSEQTHSFLSAQYRYDQKLTAAFIYYKKFPDKLFFTNNPNTGGSFSNYRFYQAEVHQQVVGMADKLDTSVGFIEKDGHLYMFRNIMDSNYFNYATIVMELNTKYLFGLFDNLNWQQGYLLYINDTLVHNSHYDLALNGIDDIVSTTTASDTVYFSQLGDRRILHGMSSEDRIKLMYLAEVADSSFISQLSHYPTLFYVLIILLLVFLVFALIFFNRQIFAPIRRLVTSTKKIREGDFGYQIETTSRNLEFTQLIDATNSMSLKLREQFEYIYSEELALRDARIMALQSQINPHFLNNTLEIINWEARLANNSRVSNMIEALSTLLHATTDRNSQPLIPLKKELEYVDAYLYIVAQRFGKNLAIEKSIDSSLLNTSVPRLIMQPVVENAIEHGFDSVSVCKVAINVYRQQDQLVIDIVNNSPLSDKSRAAVDMLLISQKKEGEFATKMGIFNVNSRLKIIYGEEYGLTITADGKQTTAKLNIPIKYIQER